jgi:hypothetical protein
LWINSSHLRPILVLFRPTAPASRWTYVRLFIRHEFGVRKHRPMPEIIDSRRTSSGHRTQIPRHFHLVPVPPVDCHPQCPLRAEQPTESPKSESSLSFFAQAAKRE